MTPVRFDTAWTKTDTSDSIPVLFTISGGISLGSYQSGVNWGLVRFMRHAHDDAAYRKSKWLPTPRFAAMAGASAGNINALLSAITWCTDSLGLPPERSLFWGAWVGTGWEQLFSSSHEGRGGVFDRSHFTGTEKELILNGLRPLRIPKRDCSVPLGMTMTRVVPTKMVITANIEAATQRYAALIEVAAAPDSSGVVFTQPGTQLFHTSLGALASVGLQAGDTVATNDVIKVLMASSAFPIAFGAVRLAYTEGGDVAFVAQCAALGAALQRGCVKRDSADFIDGGLFDNNPLALANGLYQRLQLSSPHPQQPTVLYINPDALRGTLKTSRAQGGATDSASVQGIAGLFQVVKGAYPSARQYELQSMARYLADTAVAEDRKPIIATTDRGYPIVSEHLYAFAGFLGRPFREYDFYAGAYDALHYVAQHILCVDERRSKIYNARNTELDACVRAQLIGLIDDPAFGLGPVARETVLALYAAEMHGDRALLSSGARPPQTLADSIRIPLMLALVQANAGEFGVHAGCSRGDFLDRILCTDGFGDLVDRFARAPGIRADIHRAYGYCRRRADDCIADSTVKELVDHGAREFASRRLNDVFEEIQDDPLESEMTKRLVGGAEFFFRSIDDAYQPALLADPSTVPPYAADWWHFLPYRANALFGAGAMSGMDVSWRPSVKLLSRIRAVAPLGLGVWKTPAIGDSSFHYVAEPGVGLAYHWGVPLAHDLQADWRVTTRFAGTNPRLRDQLGFRFSWQLIGGKLSLGYGRLPTRAVRPGGNRNVWSIGIGDLNGLLYYATRYAW